MTKLQQIRKAKSEALMEAAKVTAKKGRRAFATRLRIKPH